MQQKVSNKIISITDVELEFSFPTNNPFHPSILLGEQDGKRGSGQTSPDVAFLVKTDKGDGIILTECKYTEHSFYECSARRTTDNTQRVGNPDPSRCLDDALHCDYKNICHQTVWGRKYWDNLTLSNYGKSILKKCPAATSGYQLFRQQSLAEGIAKSGIYDLVVSSVAFDQNNTSLTDCLKSTGISSFQSDWGKIFDGTSKFETWTHQEWVDFVRKNTNDPHIINWLDYVNQRYGY